MQGIRISSSTWSGFIESVLITSALMFGMAEAGVVTELESGGVYYITPGNAECITNAFVDPITDDVFCPIRAGASCHDGGEADLQVTSCVTLRAIRGGAHAHYQFWFQVKPAAADDAKASAKRSFVPIRVFAPGVIWDFGLSNGSLSEKAGTASATYFLRMRRDPIDDLSARGDVVAENPVLLASHGGISGCLSIPTGFDDLANLAISCVADLSQIQQGRASPSISAIVEVGRTYSIELAMDFKVKKRLTVKPTSLEVSA